MLILGAEIGLAVMAIIALIKGKLPLTKNRVVYGWKARVLALFGLMPVPVALAIGTATLMFRTAQGQPVEVEPPSLKWIMPLVEVGLIVLCVAAMYGIGWALATAPPPPLKGRRRDEQLDDEPDP